MTNGNETIHTETLHGLTIKIYQADQDDLEESPNEWGDTDRFLVAFDSGNFWVENDLVTKELCRALMMGKDYDGSEDTLQEAKQFNKKYHVFGLEAYIHSGVCLALSHEGNFPDRQWDVSQLGCVFVARTETKYRSKARTMAKGLIETWNDYLSGNVYGYVIEDAQGNTIDSCWGYYGDYDKNALIEARSIVEHRTNKGKTDEHGQFLMFQDVVGKREEVVAV